MIKQNTMPRISQDIWKLDVNGGDLFFLLERLFLEVLEQSTERKCSFLLEKDHDSKAIRKYWKTTTTKTV